MNFILSNSNVPSFNLAAEEYFLKHSKEEYFLMYINSPSVVLGRNQNPYEEVNLKYLEDTSIDMYRRITGGGTVYHDLGNINYSFIENGLNHLSDYSYFANKIINPLNIVGVPLKFVDKSHIFLGDKKISGSAQTFYKNRVLHHGTILYDTDLSTLEDCLRHQNDISSKSVKSNKADVMNIKDYIGYNTLINTLLPDYRIFTDDEIAEISKIEKKYLTWDWNYAQSPRFTYKRKIGESELSISVRKGVVEEAVLKEPGEEHHLFELVGELFKIESFLEHQYAPRIKYVLDNIKTLY